MLCRSESCELKIQAMGKFPKMRVGNENDAVSALTQSMSYGDDRMDIARPTEADEENV